MTSTNDKFRALFLAALMVLSVAAVTISFSGAAAAANEGDVDFSTSTIHWQGQLLQLNDSASFYTGTITEGDIYEIRDDDGNTLAERVVQQNGYVLIPTSGLDTGEYSLNWTQVDSGSSTDLSFRIAVQNLDTEFTTTTVTEGDETDLEVESNRGRFNVTVQADGLDEDDLSAIFPNSVAGADGDDDVVELEAEGGGTVTANFTGISPGDYTFEFDVVDTDASATADLTVSELDVTQDFSQSVYEEEAGDVAEITVELEDATSAFIFVGGTESGWIGGVEVVDDDEDGEVTIQFNSYMAGQSEDLQADGVFTSENDDIQTYLNNSTLVSNGLSADADVSTNLSEPIEAGDYDLRSASSPAMDADGTLQNENDVATLILGERSTDGVTIHTAPQASSDSDDLEELQDALTESDTIALGDRLVIEVEASGIFGYLGNESDELNALATGSPQPVSLTVIQTNPGPNRDPAVLDLGTSDATYVSDAENNRFYVVVNTRDTDASHRDLADGQEWSAIFTVGNADNESVTYSNYVAADEEESVSGSFSLATPAGDFDNLNADSQVQVLQDSAAEVSGTANVAPGSELNVRLRASGDSPFLKTATAVVESDGTWSVEFDMSDNSIGQEFDAQLRYGSTPLQDRDGIVVDSIGTVTPTPSPTPSPTPTTAPPTTAPPPTTEPPTPTPTATADQPGFGIVVAILAILGAALLAVRRRD